MLHENRQCFEKELWHITPFGMQVMSIASLVRDEFGGQRDLSGLGGVETGRDAAEFILLGSNSVQVGACLPYYDSLLASR